ncbi:zinc-binding alcohol dehydrogenase family protein [Advenella mimigardefordensis]|uniref:Zinc-type alcohol dehydrogenase-like protein n=1 Tax=Advenella mimigardefordensis (strain DSM 17166 / LMG 22922 / DPN7) TaxID=1247726 RepID=W0P5T1_ADVMD|nr:zinc-binding alcohol dehydrogenase family protein [Advenella mimigardefordensis]AHG62199.1 zinc-type alcohol dehydrogenase-like protein [Advenella mimigardefordensis DPN7]
MKAIGYKSACTLDRQDALVDFNPERPRAVGRDMLVEIQAISVNPVDTKIRKNVAPEAGETKVLGWDAVGKIVEIGDAVTLFKPGDEVFYAGSLVRPGANSQFHLVDERIVGRKPKTLNHAEAAAMPLTAITAWEMLFDRLDIRKPVPGAANAVVIIGGAGGVGSIAIQLVRALTDLTVIATASRPETQAWVQGLGAHHVVDHSKPIASQIAALNIGSPAFVFSTTQTLQHLADIVELIAPQGRFGLIDDPAGIDIMSFKRKSVSIHWEFMFTRSMFETPDMSQQGILLNEVAGLIDQGKIRTTVTKKLSPINADNLMKAHQLIESGKSKGKLVLEGF